MATTDSTADLAAAGLIPGTLAAAVTEDARLSVRYGGHAVVRGEALSADAATPAPTFELADSPAGSPSASGGTAFTLMCVDPHAPSPDKPSLAPWLHALTVNAPGPDPSRGEEIVTYTPPSPPHGRHAYVWLAYRQPGPLTGVRTPKARARFQVKAWARDHGLDAPSAATFFWVSAEEE